MKKKEFKVGDLVRYTGKFLKNVGWYAGAPKNGKVVGLSSMGGKQVVRVVWSNDPEPMNTLAINLELDPRSRRKESVEYEGLSLTEKSPPGWAGTVKAMKKHMPAPRAFALAWSMYKKGMKPHYKALPSSTGDEKPELKKKYRGESFSDQLEMALSEVETQDENVEHVIGVNMDALFEEVADRGELTEKGNHYYDGKNYYVDTAFLNSIGDTMPGMKLDNIGFGEFSLKGNGKSIEFDRGRGKKFKGQSGKSHQIYDNKKGALVKELIRRMETKNRSELVREGIDDLDEARRGKNKTSALLSRVKQAKKAKVPSVGTRVKFSPNPVSYMMYTSYHKLPARDEEGTVTTVALPGGKKHYMPGPGGGLVYVKWDKVGVSGVSPVDVVVMKKGGVSEELEEALSFGNTFETEGLLERRPAPSERPLDPNEFRSNNPELVNVLMRSVEQTRRFVRAIYHVEEMASDLVHAAKETERIRRTEGLEYAMRRSNLGNVARAFEAETKKIYGHFAEGRDAMARLAKMARISTRRAGKRQAPSTATKEITATNLVRDVLQITSRMGAIIREAGEMGSVAIREGEKLLNQKTVIEGEKLQDRLTAYIQAYLDFKDRVSSGLYTMIRGVVRRLNEMGNRLMKMNEGVEWPIIAFPWSDDPDFESIQEDENIVFVDDIEYPSEKVSQPHGWLEAVA